MLVKEPVSSVRVIETSDDLSETRLEAIGYVFHGHLPRPDGKRQARAGTNLLHFARCGKLDKAGDGETKLWFRTIDQAKRHLDSHVGGDKWKWCKTCEREITQKILNEM